jgi:ABC-2 type transport system ATP-binding protein
MKLRLEGICKRFGSRSVLRAVDLDLAPGEIYGLLGPNGSGKSTVLNIVAGLLTADEGRVLMDGEPVSDATRTNVGFLPQEAALYPQLSCEETLRFFGGVHGVPRRDLREGSSPTVMSQLAH